MMTSRAQRITVVVVSINIDMADSDEDGGVGGFWIKVVSHFMLFPKVANFENYG